jgi:hypothetical protein
VRALAEKKTELQEERLQASQVCACDLDGIDQYQADVAVNE